jgi:VWFA-related protein
VTVLAALLAAVPEGSPVRPLVVRLEVDIVQVDVVVTDKKGRPVTDLTAADFEVLQDGKRQTVGNVAYVGSGPAASAPMPSAGADAPATPEPSGAPMDALVFVVDDHALSTPSVAATARALVQFADDMRPGDEVFLLRSSRRYVDLRPIEAAELRAAARGLRQLPDAAPSDRRVDAAGLRGTPYASTLLDTNLYLNRLLARRSLLSLQGIVDALRAWRGRKTLVLFSEGYPIWDVRGRDVSSPLDPVYGRGAEVLDEVERLSDLANRASVVIHTLDPRGLVPAGISASDGAPHPTHEGLMAAMQERRAAVHTSQASLALLAERTGGLAVANRNDVGEGVARILSGSRAYYLVGYEPDRSTFGGERPRFHRLEVRVKRPGLKVRSRKGFFGVSDHELGGLAPAPVTAPDAPR